MVMSVIPVEEGRVSRQGFSGDMWAISLTNIAPNDLPILEILITFKIKFSSVIHRCLILYDMII